MHRGDFTMDDSKVIFCAPLQQLMDEHKSLIADMDLFYEITEEIEFESGSTVVQLFAKLYNQISGF